MCLLQLASLHILSNNVTHQEWNEVLKCHFSDRPSHHAFRLG